ncbi:MAG: RHS repeat-associated core domain-containing protein, partial [Pyrinomonadaceae bacterium]
DPVTKSKRVTNSAGAIVSTIEMDPWGADTNRSSNAAFQPKKFTSYERDANGSDEAMFRRYNRWQSRFDQPDPYHGSYEPGNPQSFNRYAYVQGDPVNFVDPTGLRINLICESWLDNEGGGWRDACAFIFIQDVFFFDDPGGRGGGGGGGGRDKGDQPPTNPEGKANGQDPCDQKLAGIFGGAGAVVGSTDDPLTVGSNPNALAYAQKYGLPTDRIGERAPGHGPAPYNNPNPKSADQGGIIHIYGNAQGTASNTPLYAPSGGRVGPIFTTASGDVTRRVSYSTGLSISFVHVIPGGGPNRSGSVILGTIGGPDSGGPNYRHTHIVFFMNGARVDPRTIFCGQ